MYTVVVPVRNSAGTLGACLYGLRNQTVAPIELIVVDDASHDDSARIARHAGATVVTQRRGGPARARNLGVEAARSSIVLFTDADCVPRPDWAEKLLEPLRDDTVTACRGCYASRQRSVIARFVQMDYEDRYRRTRRFASVDFVDTYSAAYRRSVLVAVGGFDESFVHSSVEDQDLSFRLARDGHRMVFVPDAVVEHVHPASVQSYVRKKFKIGFYKPRVHIRHRDRIVIDSHTPFVLKAQTLAAVAIPAILVLVPSRRSRRSCWLLLLGISLSSLPMAARIRGKDPAVAVLTPPLALLRAFALAAGSWTGLAFLLWERLRARSRRGLSPAALPSP